MRMGGHNRDSEASDGEENDEEGAQDHKPGMSYRQMAAIWVCQLNEGMHVTLPYTLAVFMVRHFLQRADGAAESEQRVGIYTGVLAACFCAAQFLTQVGWGRVSDRGGRQPLLMMSNVSSLISVVCFGMAPSYILACAARLAGGLFNCTFVCVKTMIGEQCNTKQQTGPLVLLTLAWGVGTIIGPSIGTLSQPCDKPWAQESSLCQSGSLLRQRPFLLPCLVAAFISFIALLNSTFLIEETLPRLIRRRAQHRPSRGLARIFTLSNAYDAHQGFQTLHARAPPGVELASVAEHGSHDAEDEHGDDSDASENEAAPLLLFTPPKQAPRRPFRGVPSPRTPLEGGAARNPGGDGICGVESTADVAVTESPSRGRGPRGRALLPEDSAEELSAHRLGSGSGTRPHVRASGGHMGPCEVPGWQTNGTVTEGERPGAQSGSHMGPCEVPGWRTNGTVTEGERLGNGRSPTAHGDEQATRVAQFGVYQATVRGREEGEGEAGPLHQREGPGTGKCPEAGDGLTVAGGSGEEVVGKLHGQEGPGTDRPQFVRHDRGMLERRGEGKTGVLNGNLEQGRSQSPHVQAEFAHDSWEDERSRPPGFQADAAEGEAARWGKSSWDVVSPFDVEHAGGSGDSSPREGRPLLSCEQGVEPAAVGLGEEEVPWWKMEQVVLTVCGYSLTAFLYNLLDELVPIFASAPAGAGGLGLRVEELAIPLMTGGASLIVWALFGYPWLERVLGTMTACRIGIVGTIPLTLALALPSVLPVGKAVRVAVLTSVISVKNAMASNVFTSAMLTVNAAAPPKSIGAVNGAGQSLASIARAVGPALGGVLWSTSVGVQFPGHQFLAFAIVSASFIGLLRIYAEVQPPADPLRNDSPQRSDCHV